MGDVIYINERTGSWDEVFSDEDANNNRLQVFLQTRTKHVTLSLSNSEGEAIEITLDDETFAAMCRTVLHKKLHP